VSENDPHTTLSEEEALLLERYAAGALSPQERAELEERILASPALAEALYADESLRASLEDVALPARVISIESARERRKGGIAKLLRIALPVAAGALLVVMMPRFFRDSRPGEERMPTDEPGRRLRSPVQPSTPSSTVVGLFPFGTFSTPPPQFIWTSDAKATAYLFELLDESGDVFFSTETTDTTLALPADHSSWSRIASWRVVPLANGSAGAPSEPVRIRIDPSTE